MRLGRSGQPQLLRGLANAVCDGADQIAGIDSARFGERTRLIYEDIPGCNPPPPIDVSAENSLKSLESLGVTLNPWSKILFRVALGVTGLRKFQQDGRTIEALLRSIHLRANPFPLVMSATAAISDHPSAIDPLERAAALLIAARAMHKDLFSGQFPPDQHQGRNLEMGQYGNLFSTQIVSDGKRFRLFKSTCTSQVTVLAGGHFYSLDIPVLDDSEMQAELVKAFARIRALSKIKASDTACSAAMISAAAPQTQIKLFALSLKDSRVATTLDTLRHSFLTLCLDLDVAPASLEAAARIAHSGNCSNRWYNSALQIVVFGNSKSCLIFNYNAYLDGNVQVRSASEIWHRSTRLNPNTTSDGKTHADVALRELSFPAPADLVSIAQTDISGILDDQQATFELAGFGKSFFASHDLESVPAFVAGLQLAVFRLTGRASHIRQLVAMSKYRYMDLANAVVTTREMLSFLESMEDSGATREQQREKLKAAINSQVAQCRIARQYLPPFRLASLLAESKGGIRCFWIAAVMKATRLSLRLMGLAPFSRNDITISHPLLCGEVPIIGRPGVRLPYLQCFGLHYQIFEDRAVLTWMPALNWRITNQEMTNQLTQALHDLGSIASGASPNGPIPLAV